MTTIAYHHNSKTLAIDSRRTGDNHIVTDCDNKWEQLEDGSVMFLCGQVVSHEKLIEAYYGKVFPEDEIIHSNAYLVFGGNIYRTGVEEGKFWKELVYFDSAMGSGWEFALAAMDFGEDAEGAVKYAAKRDYHTGGKVHVYNVKAGEFI